MTIKQVKESYIKNDFQRTIYVLNFEYVLLFKGRTTNDESIMFYETGTYHSTYQNKSFIPMFVPQFRSPAEEEAARNTCGSNSQCLFDYAATGDSQLANAVIANTKAVNSTTRLFGKLYKTLFTLIVSTFMKI